jgi:serine/threonine protein kinase/WD40 repeat protein
MNSQPSAQRDPLDAAAESFLERFRLGQRPSVADYAEKYPELAEKIERLFPALVFLEEAGAVGGAGGQRGRGATCPELLGPQRLGEYRLVREVGRGGMGVVYEAVQESLGRRVAVKILPFSRLTEPSHLERFRREARAAARLHHTNIVPVFGVGEDRGVHYYAMQFIQGVGLDLVLADVRRLRSGTSQHTAVEPIDLTCSEVAQALLTGQFRRRTGDAQTGFGEAAPCAAPANSAAVTMIDPTAASDHDGRAAAQTAQFTNQPETHYFRSVARLGVQVAEALAYAHGHGVIHRDIKPSNLLLDTSGTVWVTDFGLAKAEGCNELTGPGAVLGTLRYMAPERFQGKSDPLGDVYSLGMTLYELLTLQPALRESDRARLLERLAHESPAPPRKLEPRIPRDLETVVLKAIASEPAARYASAEALAEDLRRFLADRPVRARRTSAVERAWRMCRRNPIVASLTASVALLLVLIATGSTVLSVWLRRERDTAIGAKNEQRRQHVLATKERVLRERAERQATERRLDSFLASVAQARAARLSREVGQRHDCLQAVREAVRIARSLHLSQDHYLSLRNEAIASMALPELQLRRRWTLPKRQPQSLDFDPDFERYATFDASWNPTIRSLRDDRVVRRIPCPLGGSKGEQPARPRYARGQFSPDGRCLAAHYFFVGQEPRVFVWDLAEPTTIPKLALDAQAMNFLLDGRGFVTVFNDGSLGLHDLRSGKEVSRLGVGLAIPDGEVPIDADTRQIIVGNRRDRTLRLVDLNTSIIRHLGSLPDRAVPRRVACRVDGRLAAVAGEDFRIFVYRLPGWQLVRVLDGHQASVQGLAFTGRGDLLASHGWDGYTILWNPLTGRRVLTSPGTFVRFRRDDGRIGLDEGSQASLCDMIGHPEFTVLHQPGLGLAFSPDGSLLAVSSDGVGLWDARTGQEVAHLNVGWCGSVAFDPRGETLAACGNRGLVLVPMRDESRDGARQIRFGPSRTIWEGGTTHWHSVCFSRTGRLAAGSRDQDRLVIDPENAGRERSHASNSITTLALSPDGRWAAAGAWYSGKVRIWDLSSAGGPIDLATGDQPEQTSHAAFSPDSLWLATSGAQSHRIWRVGSWARGLDILRDRVEPSGSPLAYSPSGRVLAVCRSQQIVQLLKADSGQEIATLTPPEPANVSALEFSPDGSKLAVAHAARTVHVWNLGLVQDQLAELGLEWSLPSASPTVAAPRPGAINVEALPPELLATEQRSSSSLEAEDLRVVARKDCDAMVQDMTGWPSFRWHNDRHLFCRARLGGYVELEVEVGRSGDYRLEVQYTTAPDFGIAQVNVDGCDIGEPFDAYSDSVQPSAKVGIGVLPLTAGPARLRFTAVGKNTSSIDYYMGIDSVDLTPVDSTPVAKARATD